MELFSGSLNQNQKEVTVRIDLTKQEHTALMRSIKHDDVGSIKDYVQARLEKDKKGYFLRLQYHDARLLRGSLYSLWEKLSNETLQILPEAIHTMNESIEKESEKQTETKGAFNKFMAISKAKEDLEELIQVFDYQFCPEEYHPFGPR